MRVLEPPNSESQELDPDSIPQAPVVSWFFGNEEFMLGMGEAQFAQLLWENLTYSPSGGPALAWALQERWRVAAEKSKAESAQRSLEEQRKVMVQQISMEREELERAKVSPAPHPAADPTIPARGHSLPSLPLHRAPC